MELAVFADTDEQKGHCARALEKINDTILPQGLHLARMDFRFMNAGQQQKIKKAVEQEKPLDEKQRAMLTEDYTLPRAAMQGLSITGKQPMAVLDPEPVEERLGPFARNHDGGSLTTEGVGLGTFPKFYCNITRANLATFGQPYRKLQTFGAADGTSTNVYHSLIFGNGSWYFQLPAGLCRIDVQCDWTTGWRLVHRGDTPFGFQLRPGQKLMVQVIGPEKWSGTPYGEADLFDDQEVLRDV